MTSFDEFIEKCRKGRFDSHDMVVEQWDLASEAYKKILRKIHRDNDERMCLMVGGGDRIQLQEIRAVKGSVLAAVAEKSKKEKLHKLVFAYTHGAESVASLSSKRGGKTLDHRNANYRDNNPENLWALAHELNSFRQSETTERKAGERFVLPMHQFMVDKNNHKFKAPFTKKLLDSHPSGEILRKTYGYDENKDKMILGKFYSKKSTQEIECTFNTIITHLCRFLLYLIEHPDRPLEALGLGWRGTAKANNVTYLRSRLKDAETRIMKLKSASKKRKRELISKMFNHDEKKTRKRK
jgi:hypothetical protein